MASKDQSTGGQWRDPLPRFQDLVKRFSLFNAFPKCNPQIGQGGSIACDCNECKEWHAFLKGTSSYCTIVQYEVFTLEHVKGLAEYLQLRNSFYKLPLMKVLEVGAGTGKLCHHLNHYLSQARDEDRVVILTATDNGQRGLNGPAVAKRDAIQAISQELPHVVLVSWMPIVVDWTAQMRATPSVIEYILIGEADNGICGHPWLTWGYTEIESSDDSSSDEQPFESDCFSRRHTLYDETKVLEASFQSFGTNPWGKQLPPDKIRDDNLRAERLTDVRRAENSDSPRDNSTHIEARRRRWNSSSSRPLSGSSVDLEGASVIEVAPYKADGWVRIELPALSSFQICRTDERWSTRQHSSTVSFRRNPSDVSHGLQLQTSRLC